MIDMARTADRIAGRFTADPTDDEMLWDVCDLETGSELDCVEMDILVGMVSFRLRSARRG